MRFTPRLAKLSIALTAVVFVLIAALWNRSAGHKEAIMFQSESTVCSLVQADGVIAFVAIPWGFFDNPGFHYTDDGDRPLNPPVDLGWGGFSFTADSVPLLGLHVVCMIPHGFLLCLSTLLLLPAVVHWRMRKTHAAQQAALSGRDSP